MSVEKEGRDPEAVIVKRLMDEYERSGTVLGERARDKRHALQMAKAAARRGI